MKVFILSFLLGQLVVFRAEAQSDCVYTLKGKVVDEQNQPMQGATIVVQSTGAGKVSDAGGAFEFLNLCPGNNSLEIKFLGYASQAVKFNAKRSSTLLVKLKPEDRLLSEVVVSDKANEAPAVADYGKLSGRELEEARSKTLGEALKDITGVSSIQTGPTIFKPVIHGVHSQRILILNNGVRQEGQQWGAEHAPEIDPFIASNILVIKDAGALKYGTDALGGVVVVTPPELPTTAGMGGQVYVMGNTNGWSGITSAMLEGGIKKHDGWGWRLQGTAKKSGDFHAADYNLSNTGYSELNYSGSVGYHDDAKGLEIYYSHFSTTLGILRGSAVGSADDLAAALEREPPQYTEPFTYSIQQPRQEIDHNLFKVSSHLIRGNNRYNLQYGLQYNHREEFDVRQGSLKDVPALAYKLYTQTLDAEWEKTISPSRVSCRGINAMFQDNRKVDGTQTIPFIPNFLSASTGLFWIEELSLGKWDLKAGARYDFRFYKVAGLDFRNELYHSDLNFNNLSGSIGGTYRISETSSFTSDLASTWRPPNVAELYSLGTHQSAAAIEYGLLLDETTNEVKDISDSHFKIEKAVKWVNTYRFSKNRWKGEVSAYINYIFNYIYLKPQGVTQNLRGIFPYFRYTQTDASFLGADIALSYQLTSHWKIGSKVSLLRAEDVTNQDYLGFIPANRYDFQLRYEMPSENVRKNFYVEARVRFVAQQGRAPRVITVREINEAKEQGIDLLAGDSRNFDFAPAPSGYGLVSLAAGLSRPVGKSLMDIRISVENLANVSYREYTNRMRYYADDIGRNISLALRYSF